MRNRTGIVAACLVTSAIAFGQTSQKAPSPESPKSKQSTTPSEFGKASHESMQKMEKDMMDAPMTGDADRDFMQMMIPHHQGAIDMAKALLKSGDDPKVRKMAQKVISDQEREIKEMKAWLDEQKDQAAH